MEERLAEIEQAISLSVELSNVGIESPPERLQLKERVTQFLHEFEQSPDVWKFGIELFSKSSNEYARFYGLSRVSSTLERDAASYFLSDEDRAALRATVTGWVNQYAQVPRHFRNKVGLCLALLVKREYPERWPNAFSWLLPLASQSRDNAELFLRVLHFVTQEIVEYRQSRSQEEVQQNTLIKDTMRVEVLNNICEFWLQVLINFHTSDTPLVQECLSVIEEYVGWIDIGLIVNDRFMPPLYEFLSSPSLRVHALKVFTAILCKGMESEQKVALIRNLDLGSALKRVCDVDNVANPNNKQLQLGSATDRSNRDDDDDDDDEDQGWGFRENVSVLVNEIALRLLEARASLPDDGSCAQVHSFILDELRNRIMPLAVRECLMHEDEDAQVAIVPSIMKLISIAREANEVNLDQKANYKAVRYPKSEPKVDSELEQLARAMMPEILNVVASNMVIPEDYGFVPTNEDEIDFEHHRNEMRKIFVQITKVAMLEVTLPFLRDLVGFTMKPGQPEARPPQEVEVTLSLLYAFGEGAPSGVVSSANRTLLDMAKLGNAQFSTKSKKQRQNQLRNGIFEPVNPSNAENGVAINPDGTLKNDEAKAREEDERRAAARAAFTEIIAQMLRCGLWNHSNNDVVLFYNEVSTRYVSMLVDRHQDLLLTVLKSLVAEGGICHKSMRVRSRSCYMLLRVVKGIGTQILQPFAADLFEVLQPKLSITSEAVRADVEREEAETLHAGAGPGGTLGHAADISRASNGLGSSGNEVLYAVEDMAYLYELASVLIGAMHRPDRPMTTIENLGRVMSPLRNKVDEIVQNVEASGPPMNEEQEKKRKILGAWAGECIHAMGVLSKGLPEIEVLSESLQKLYESNLETSLRALGALSQSSRVRSRLMTMLHCALRIMGEKAIHFAPGIGLRLLQQSDNLDHLLQAMQFINQLIPTYKGRMYDALDPIFLPVIQHITSTMARVPNPFADDNRAITPTSPADPSQGGRISPAGVSGSAPGATPALTSAQQEYRAVKRALLHFFRAVATNDLDMVFFSQTNAPHAEQVLMLISDALATFPDANSSQKIACSVMNKLTDIWLVPETRPGLQTQARELYAHFLMNHATPATLRATTLPGFSMDDYDSVALVDSICKFHANMARRLGQTWLRHFVDNVLPGLTNNSCPQQIIVEYCQALTTIESNDVSPKDLRVKYAPILQYLIVQ